jgi:hypothetical protein
MPEHAGPISLDRRGFLRSLGGGLAVLVALDDLARRKNPDEGAAVGATKLPQTVAAGSRSRPTTRSPDSPES